MLTQLEVSEFRAAVRGELARVWPSPRTAGDAEAGHALLAAVWATATTLGWTELGSVQALDAAVEGIRELGRAACPLPLMDVYVTLRLLAGRADLAHAIVSGSLRPVVAIDPGDASVPAVEAAGAATHLLLLPNDRRGHVRLCSIRDATLTPGLAIPEWADVRVGTETGSFTLIEDAVEEAMALLRLGLAARAMAAAAVAHELAVEHAKTRQAFGKPIGSFQAVSHRCANGEIDVTAARALVDEAVRLHGAGDPAWLLAGELAVAYAAAAAPRVQLGAHHTLAAIGFFEEHAAPWLFRRVHADVLRLAAFPVAAGGPADMMLERGASLPRLELGAAAERFRGDLGAFLDARLQARGATDLSGDGELTHALATNGYIGMAWPPADGGRRASVEELMVLHAELRYRGAEPKVLSAAELIGNAIMRHGSDEQKARFLPLIAEGRLPFYLGYSEPEVGSDLAALRTRAVRDGDGWIINGQKLWGTGAQSAEYCWLAARTDPEADPPHRGITVFLVRVPCPGWQMQQHVGLSGEVSCTTFFDDVRVPDTARVGEVNEGWRVMRDALAGERVVMGGVAAHVHHQFDELLTELRADPNRAGPRGSAVRARVTALATRLHAARILVNQGVRATATGGGARLEAPMAKIVAGEVYEDLCEAALDILGPRAALAGSVPGVPGGGRFEQGARIAIKSVVGGGTNDIQRNLIARSLGLPR
jgi:alkylation response protein AidB-like acyl-CoA dehydrogenase